MHDIWHTHKHVQHIASINQLRQKLLIYHCMRWIFARTTSIKCWNLQKLFHFLPCIPPSDIPSRHDLDWKSAALHWASAPGAVKEGLLQRLFQLRKPKHLVTHRNTMHFWVSHLSSKDLTLAWKLKFPVPGPWAASMVARISYMVHWDIDGYRCRSILHGII